jgi:hypothetical protein
MGGRRSLRTLAVATLALVVASASPEAVAATSWTVGLTAGNSPMARSVPIPPAPGKPDARCVSPLGSSVDISWAAVSGARGYTVRRNGRVIKSVDSSTLTIRDTIVSLLGGYTYTVAVDIAGSWSGPQSPPSDTRNIVLLVGCV